MICYRLTRQKALHSRAFRGWFKHGMKNESSQSKNEVLTGNKTAGAVKQKKFYNFLSL